MEKDTRLNSGATLLRAAGATLLRTYRCHVRILGIATRAKISDMYVHIRSSSGATSAAGKAGGEGGPGEHVGPPVEQQHPQPGAAHHRQLRQAGCEVLRQVCRANLTNPGKLLSTRN